MKIYCAACYMNVTLIMDIFEYNLVNETDDYWIIETPKEGHGYRMVMKTYPSYFTSRQEAELYIVKEVKKFMEYYQNQANILQDSYEELRKKH